MFIHSLSQYSGNELGKRGRDSDDTLQATPEFGRQIQTPAVTIRTQACDNSGKARLQFRMREGTQTLNLTPKPFPIKAFTPHPNAKRTLAPDPGPEQTLNPSSRNPTTNKSVNLTLNSKAVNQNPNPKLNPQRPQP